MSTLPLPGKDLRASRTGRRPAMALPGRRAGVLWALRGCHPPKFWLLSARASSGPDRWTEAQPLR